MSRSFKEAEELIKDIREWAEETFPESTLASTFAHVKEEMDEIEQDPHDIHEWADALMMMFHQAHNHGFTLSDILDGIESKFEIIKGREWLLPDEQGIVRHKK